MSIPIRPGAVGILFEPQVETTKYLFSVRVRQVELTTYLHFVRVCHIPDEEGRHSSEERVQEGQQQRLHRANDSPHTTMGTLDQCISRMGLCFEQGLMSFLQHTNYLLHAQATCRTKWKHQPTFGKELAIMKISATMVAEWRREIIENATK